MSSFQYHTRVLLYGAWKQLALLSQCSSCNWNVIAIIPPRKENTPVLVVLHKALLKAEIPWVNTHTTWEIRCKHCPSVHHSCLWSPCSTYTLGVSWCSNRTYTVLPKTRTNTQHSRSCPGTSHTAGRKREHKQMYMGTKATKMSLLGQRALARNSMFWEVPWWLTSLDSFGCIWHHGVEWWHKGLPTFCVLDKIPLLKRFLETLMYFNGLRAGPCGPFG